MEDESFLMKRSESFTIQPEKFASELYSSS